MRTTLDDLDWWLATASNLDWIWAKTYAHTAPHEYVVEGRSAGLGHDDFVRAGRVIHTFGRPAKFYSMTSIYLGSPDGRLKWWTMDPDVRDTTLINQATTERLYGVQNAPVTISDVTTPYDEIATGYDAEHPTTTVLAETLRAAAAELAAAHTPSVLDVGCGTGRVLDLGLTTADRYAGVDPSTPMLNQLVRKHPTVGAVYPTTIEHALDAATFSPGQFEIVTLLLVDEIPPNVVDALSTIASRGVITLTGGRVEVIHTSGARARGATCGGMTA